MSPLSSFSQTKWVIGVAVSILVLVFLSQHRFAFQLFTPTSLPFTSSESESSTPTRAPGLRTIETPLLYGYSHDAIQIYFTRSQDGGRDSELRYGLDRTVASDLERARRSISVATFDFDLSGIAEVLIQAHKRGVRVQMVVDSENLADVHAAYLLGTLEQHGIPIVYDRRPALMHDKFIVIDGQIVWTGSWNLTLNDTFRNNNNMFRVKDTRLAEVYERKFASLFGGQEPEQHVPATVEHGDTTMEVLFSPEMSITARVIEAIEHAQQRVDVLAFTFTSDPLADAILAARARGVGVRAVIESRNANGRDSKFADFRRAGILVLKDGNCFHMHHKTIIVDDQAVITGSFNWTAGAQERNDENIVLLHSPWLAQVYEEEFRRVWERARQPARCK